MTVTPPIISVAPMMDYTNRHCRYFMRLLSPETVLYTEMVTAGAILHGDRDRFLQYDSAEHPVVLQLGGSQASEMVECAKIAEDLGYDEVNINIGCPSVRVQNGAIGACLMGKPEVVAECVNAMKQAVSIPVTVKTRIGIDHDDSYDFLNRFITLNKAAGCQHFIIHARKAWLSGLSPKQNRTIPELNYQRVYDIKSAHPELQISINGGIKTITDIKSHLQYCDGVMIGREAFAKPYLLAEIEREIFGNEIGICEEAIIHRYRDYVDHQLAEGVYLSHLIKPILGLFQGRPGARTWRRHLSMNSHQPSADSTTIMDALKAVATR